MKKKKEASSAFAAAAEKRLHSKGVFTLRMSRAEDERKEETWILSYRESGAGRGGGREERMV